MIKLILILLGLMLAWWVLSRYRSSLARGQTTARPVEDMVPCAHCGTHTPRSECIAGGDKLFCNDEHKRLGSP
jgi:uncharacterized protein